MKMKEVINKNKVNKCLSSLIKAKNVKNDEFYTYYKDVEKWLNFHIDKFKGKVVYCCCDNPIERNFFKTGVNCYGN